MPIYTYKCKKCGKVFEKLQKMGTGVAENCEDCNSETMRVFSPAGIIFKGSGFYTTDYKSGSNRANLNTVTKQDNKKEIKKEENKAQPQPEQKSGKAAGSHTESKDKK